MTDDLHHQLAQASSALVADALDALGMRDQVVDPRVRPLFPAARVAGPALPVSVIEDLAVPDEPYAAEMAALSALQPGDVGVYAVSGTSRAAAWGELFSCGAIGRGARGVLVDGHVRDARQIAELGFPVFCSGTSPLDTLARARVDTIGQPIVFGGVTVCAGDFVIADADGVVVVPLSAIPDAATFVVTKHRLEQGARDDLMAGMEIRDVWAKYGVF